MTDRNHAIDRNIVNQILDASGADVATRQRINDDCDAFVVKMIDKALAAERAAREEAEREADRYEALYRQWRDGADEHAARAEEAKREVERVTEAFNDAVEEWQSRAVKAERLYRRACDEEKALREALAAEKAAHEVTKQLASELPTDMLHPEFGTEWREPDGVIWKAIQSEKARADKAQQECDLHKASLGDAMREARKAYDRVAALEAKINALTHETGPTLSCAGFNIREDGCFVADLCHRLDALTEKEK